MSRVWSYGLKKPWNAVNRFMGYSGGNVEKQRAGRSNDGEEQAPKLSEKSVNSAQNWEGSFRAHSGQGSVLLCPRPENLNEAGLKGDGLIVWRRKFQESVTFGL